MINKPVMPVWLLWALLLPTVTLLQTATAQNPTPDERPNIVWIIAEDVSPDIGVYGNTLVETPNINRLAREGVRFARAFATNPICSPARSALVSGMYQTTLGAHNHRSQGDTGKRKAHEHYYDSYELPSSIKLLPELFQDAGYYTTLGRAQGTATSSDLAKSDYNFRWDSSIYDGNDWSARAEGQPFFAQIQLSGGKNRGAEVGEPVNPSDVALPPYYPDHPVLRQDWAEYLNSIQHLDQQVGHVLDRLEEEGVADNTIVFFMSDHGISHMRGKQYLYDEGIHIPLIVRWPGHVVPNTVRGDLVEHIDVAATSLAAAGLSVPGYVQGRNFFAEDYEPRRYVFSARDRADETVDIIRAVRGPRYKYIRNYYSDRPHAQPNQYKDGKEIIQIMRTLHEQDALDAVQDRVFDAERPPEELYDVWVDPHETRNLAGSPEHASILRRMRRLHVSWMNETRDMGLIPEPILEELGREHGNKFTAMQQIDHAALIDRIRHVIRLSEQGPSSMPELERLLTAEDASVRFWAARGLAHMGETARHAHEGLLEMLHDSSAAVRVSAAQTLGITGRAEQALPVLVRELQNDNRIAGMYAALALEDMGTRARPVLAAIEEAAEGPYEFTRRVARRMLINLDSAP